MSRTRLLRDWYLVWGCSSAALLGCGGGARTAPVESPPALDATARPTPQADHVDAVPSDARASATVSPANDAPSPAAEPPLSDDSNATREVIYVVTPEALKISVAGVKFSVSATAARVGAGFGVKLNVTSVAHDGKPHSLANPKTGPLAFAGAVTRNGKSEPEVFGDERSGEGEVSVFGDDPSKFTRTWPGRGTRPLAKGDALDLQVALWGLGANTESRRPVKKFCHVRLVFGQGRPRAVVEPPTGAAGS